MTKAAVPRAAILKAAIPKVAILCALMLAGTANATTASSGTGALADVQAALDAGDAARAIVLADAALKDAHAGARGGLLYCRGVARELLGLNTQALADFTAALRIPGLPRGRREQVLLQRGFLRDGLGWLDAAADDYSTAIRMDGAVAAVALNNRANIYRRQNRLALAQRDYRAALAHGGRPQYAWYGLGQIAEAGGDVEGARGSYAKAVAADPGYLLAADRLAALGGPAEDAAPAVTGPADTSPVHAARLADARPAGTRSDLARIVLRPPREASGVAETGQGRVRLASVPALRPALDSYPQDRPPAAPKAGNRAGVQLGAWRSQAEARQGWEKAVHRAGGALDGLEPRIVTADLPGQGRYYRLRTVAGNDGPARLCAQLTAAGQACFPVRD